MTWSEFLYFASLSSLLWLSSAVLIYRKPKLANVLNIMGIANLVCFIVLFWISLQRAPMRTMGETRLWYSLFISLVGYLWYIRLGYKWLLSYSSCVATVFLIVNMLKPELHSQNLMPALQSPWFIPHVSSYILSYAMFGAACIGAIICLLNKNREIIGFIDTMIFVGYGFLMLGLLMGALWAKEAWGHYWSWDPKETWALITTAAYLVYIHVRIRDKQHLQLALWVVIIAFVLLMITWLGVSYLPSSSSSVHVY
ncbi:MAG: cytochrome c biogenesis protein CcsA [Rikenellaceae bacterium]